MNMCAGVQNESRPMLSCQEMSQAVPTTADTTENMQIQMYQGIDIVPTEALSAIRTFSGCAIGMLFAMLGVYPQIPVSPTSLQIPIVAKFTAFSATDANSSVRDSHCQRKASAMSASHGN